MLKKDFLYHTLKNTPSLKLDTTDFVKDTD